MHSQKLDELLDAVDCVLIWQQGKAQNIYRKRSGITASVRLQDFRPNRHVLVACSAKWRVSYWLVAGRMETTSEFGKLLHGQRDGPMIQGEADAGGQVTFPEIEFSDSSVHMQMQRRKSEA